MATERASRVGRWARPALAVIFAALLPPELPQGQARSREPEPATSPTPTAPPATAAPARRCPPEMVDVAGELCIDRWELHLVERTRGARVSPYYHPSRALALRDQKEWAALAKDLGPLSARSRPLPELPAWQTERDFEIVARSAPDQVPNAYLDLDSARRACVHAGKRLCRRKEWIRACRGSESTRHPYGEDHDPARCNLDAPVHPGNLLHGMSQHGGRDPRLNLVEHAGRTLLRPTGTLLGCASPWAEDAVYDMEGNLDEWVDDETGVFLGGFYARDTRWGCDARVDVHTADYYDYSLGARCCR